jgi:solute:Na+ symporter, SSS family
LAGVLAGTMSTLAAKALAISSLFVRNVYRQIWPGLSEKQGVYYARWTVISVLALGAVSAWSMGNFLSIVNLVLTVNLPFGAAVLLTFFWRRLTAPAVWSCVVLSTLLILVIPWTAAKVPFLRLHPGLTQTSPGPDRLPVPVYFGNVVHQDPEDLTSPLVGSGRFDFECWLLDQVGVNVPALGPNQRFTLQFFFDGLFPFVVLILVSWITPPTDPKRVALFYGKMKTPVGATPELEEAGLEETRRNPARFDHTKLLPKTNWEFCKWDRVDAIGFLICSALTAAIVELFVFLLKLAAG